MNKFRTESHQQCNTIGCFKVSVAVVVNNKGAKYGYYCKSCAKERLVELEESHRAVPHHEMPSR